MAGIFKAYDVRGVVPEELDEPRAYRLGRAFVRFLTHPSESQIHPNESQDRRFIGDPTDRRFIGGPATHPNELHIHPDESSIHPAIHPTPALSVVVGHDARLSSPSLAEAFTAGATDEGAEVTSIGLVGTCQTYFALGAHRFGAGAMVTASHNPKQYNGFKLLREGVAPLSGESGLPEVSALYQGISAEPFVSCEGRRVGARHAAPHLDIYAEYSRHVLSFIQADRILPLKVVLDAGNGAAGLAAQRVFEGLPQVRTIPLNFQPDGNFPAHEPNPQLAENRREIEERIRAEGADLGIAWDGDGDRCYFLDEEGRFIDGYYITTLLIEAILRQHSGEKVIFDTRLTWANLDAARAFGGIPLINRAGHSFIKARMRAEGAIFGGEVSGHFYFRRNFFADDGMIPALLILELLSTRREKLSQLVGPLEEKYPISREINVQVADVEALLAEVERRYADGAIDHLDGLSVEYPQWRFNLRSSQTEPLVRLNVEARQRELVEEKTAELMALLSTDLRSPQQL
ncbi:MAG: phosphomannomutase/phosphoglucomutase [Coprothermobacterota bacterium]|nr:phosphomannomutase/phosphoglucomutase [Coprothermobacterota bacterium]